MVSILDDIRNVPDLQDFISYCQPILDKIENIKTNIKTLSNQNSFLNSNYNFSYKLDSILNQHLPNSINSYLKLTFQYRNTKKTNINGQNITAKEALLLNLSHIDTQVNKIEEEFNEINKMDLMAQNRLLRQMSETELEPETNHKFVNQFDINNFKKSETIIYSPKQQLNDKEIETIKKKHTFSKFESIFLYIVCTSLIFSCFFILNELINDNHRIKKEAAQAEAKKSEEINNLTSSFNNSSIALYQQSSDISFQQKILQQLIAKEIEEKIKKIKQEKTVASKITNESQKSLNEKRQIVYEKEYKRIQAINELESINKSN